MKCVYNCNSNESKCERSCVNFFCKFINRVVIKLQNGKLFGATFVVTLTLSIQSRM